MDKIIYQKYANKLDEYKYVLSAEKEHELQQFTFEMGLANGDLFIKCDEGEVRTHSLIFEIFSEHYNHCKRVLALGEKNNNTNDVFTLDLSMYSIDTVKNVLCLLYREGCVYKLTNIKQIIDFFLLAEMLLLFNGAEKSLKLCWKHIKQYVINGNMFEPYILDDCLQLVSNYDTYYIMKLFIFLLKKHDSEVEKTFTEHNKCECSCKNGIMCNYMKLHTNYRNAIENYLFPLYVKCGYCRRKSIGFCNGVNICKRHFYK